MSKTEFETKMERAFHSGGIFKRWYFEFLDKNMTLQKIASDIKDDLKYQLQLPNLPEEYENWTKLAKWNTETDSNCHLFFCSYLEDATVCSHPELCGEIVAALSRKQMFDEAVKLIGLDEIGDDEELYWDT